VECALYRQFFYFPKSSQFSEGVARFDRIQVVINRDPSAIVPMNISLSTDVFGLFRSMFLYCVAGKEDEDLMTLRKMTAEAYPQNNR
jgi:hypothetical protein